MRFRSAFLVLSCLITGFAFSQSKCQTAEVGTNVFDKRPEFEKELQIAETVFVTVYHDPQNGLVDPPPPDSIERVKSTIARWPIASNDERALIGNVKGGIVGWGRFVLTRDASNADLILVAKVGRNAGDPTPNRNYFDIPLTLLWDDGLYLYSKTAKPGLIWCGHQAGGLHPSEQGLALFQRLVTDAQWVPDGR